MHAIEVQYPIGGLLLASLPLLCTYGSELYLRGTYVCVHIYTCLNLAAVMELALRGSESWKCSVTLILLSSTCSLRRITNISSCSGRRGWEAGPALVESLHACIAQRRESAVKIRAVSILIKIRAY